MGNLDISSKAHWFQFWSIHEVNGWRDSSHSPQQVYVWIMMTEEPSITWQDAWIYDWFSFGKFIWKRLQNISHLTQASTSYHTEAQTKWPSFCKRHIQTRVLQKMSRYFQYNSLDFIPEGPIDCKSALAQLRAWQRTGDKPSPVTMASEFIDTCMIPLGHKLLISKAIFSNFPAIFN